MNNGERIQHIKWTMEGDLYEWIKNKLTAFCRSPFHKSFCILHQDKTVKHSDVSHIVINV